MDFGVDILTLKKHIEMKKFNALNMVPIVMLGCLLVVFSSCKKDETEEPAVITDDNFYMMVGVSMINCYTDIYNQNLAGVATGSHNINTNGPMGGTVVITGTTSYDNTHGITTTDLILTMTEVKYNYSYTDGSGRSWSTQVTLTGATTYTGSFSDGYTSVNHQSENLRVIGTVNCDGVIRSIDSMGTVSINRSSTTAVNLFGHIVTW
jgi:hypothetical protein